MLKYERTDAVFQPTLPVRGATRCVLLPVLIVFNFNPRSPCGERLHSIPNGFVVSNFNPRSPCGERPSRGLFHFRYSEFQPTLPVRGATAIVANPLLPDIISTHAPRAGSDDFIHCIYLPYPISTHAPRAGSDKKALFGVHADRDFNPRSPCGERLKRSCISASRFRFQPTLPVRGATPDAREGPENRKISTHAPRAGSDHQIIHDCPNLRNFNPRSPCGERPCTCCMRRCRRTFQPTLPVRGATIPFAARFVPPWYFNPRSPCGERHLNAAAGQIGKIFQPTLPVRGATKGEAKLVDGA